MKKIMNFLMLSCKKATELIEKKNFQSLSMNERFQLNIHTKMCRQCKTFEKQSVLFDKVLTKISANKEMTPIKENEELKIKILKKING